MKISLNALKQYVNMKVPVSELLTLIGSRLVEIEGTIDLSEKYKNIKIVKVAECEKIAGTHLSLCQIDAGTKELIQVVCGAPNVHRGMLAVWLAPGVIVPSTFGNENFKLGSKKLRGFESNGMLAAADELDFWPDHEGILEINPKDAKPGDSFAEIFDLNDIILDIENKSLTHRPDCFGLVGFAREVAGILGEEFTNPEYLFLGVSNKNSDNLKIEIKDSEICPRYSCAVLDASKLQEKSKYLQKSDIFLFKAGMRPVSPIVDLTNIIMLETGQPLHAFDYDKFASVGGAKIPQIIVRLANNDEELQLLDGKTIKCVPTDILITSNNVPVALAGAMGGANTEIDASTKKIILESATFSLYNLRKTQMEHGIFSEAITRFTKGQPAEQTSPVLREAIRRLDATPEVVADCYPAPGKLNIIKISTKEINSLLGSDYSIQTIVKTLENVNFSVYAPKIGHTPKLSLGKFAELQDDEIAIVAPSWRTDIFIKEDIVEEVGRLLGYDNIPLDFPTRPFIESKVDDTLVLKNKIRTILSDRLGANEVLSYSFVSEDLLSRANLDTENVYKIVNSISPELQCFRSSIVPSLIEKMRDNFKSGHNDFTLYEMNQISSKDFGCDADGVPIVKTSLAVALFGDFYTIKNITSQLFAELGLNLDIAPIDKHPYFEPLHSAVVSIDGTPVAYLGEIKKSVLRRFKVEKSLAVLEMNLESIKSSSANQTKQISFSKFPSVFRDLTLKVSADTDFAAVQHELMQVLDAKSLISSIQPVSIYQPESNLKTKNISFHLSFSNPNKTLDSQEISDIMEEINHKLSKTLGAEVV